MRAFVFPGQGAQTIGMGRELAEAYPAAMDVFREVDEALGEDLSKLIWDGDIEELTLTRNAQPALMATSMAAFRALEAEGFGINDADYVAGHSLGEYSALVAAGVLSLGQAIPLVRLRAAAMQAAVPVGVGAMAAVLGLDAEKVKAVCAQVTADLGGAEVVEAVNFNDPGQTVIAGSKAAVDAAGAAMKTAGAKRALPLPVSAPFHSSLMQPAAEQLKAALAGITFAAPQIDVINNIDVAVVHEGAAIADALYRQAFGPVRWVESVQALKARGITHVVECGPGKVLAGMVKRIDADLIGAALYDPATLAEVKELLA